jgi:hypothetical protein
MLNLDAMKTPTADGRNPTQAKYTLSEEARTRLRLAAAYSGQDMSTILELLIMTQLDLPGPDRAQEPPRAVVTRHSGIDTRSAAARQEEEEENRDIDIDGEDDDDFRIDA